LTGLDTNVLVRYIMQDDPEQSQLATNIINGFDTAHPGYISQIALVETVWVLSRKYKQHKNDIVSVIERMLNAKELIVENSETVRLALKAHRNTNTDFADALISHSGVQFGCTETLTFDIKAGRLKGMRLLQK